jgi:hypothetical protein
VPAGPRIELAQVGEHSMHGCIEVSRLFRNPLAHPLEFTIHDDANGMWL